MAGMTLWSEHIATICDLQKICSKHNCKIAIGFRTGRESELNSDEFMKLFTTEEDKEKAKRFLEGDFDVDEGICESETYWFELHENDGKMLGNMVDVTSNYHFELSGYSYSYDALDSDVQDWVDDNSVDYDCDSSSKIVMDFDEVHETILNGVFKGKEVNCYREGICLKEFADLVCDYLGEPRIVRNY